MNQNEEDYWTTHAAPLDNPEKGMTKIYMKCSEARFVLSSVVYLQWWWRGSGICGEVRTGSGCRWRELIGRVIDYGMAGSSFLCEYVF